MNDLQEDLTSKTTTNTILSPTQRLLFILIAASALGGISLLIPSSSAYSHPGDHEHYSEYFEKEVNTQRTTTDGDRVHLGLRSTVREVNRNGRTLGYRVLIEGRLSDASGSALVGQSVVVRRVTRGNTRYLNRVRTNQSGIFRMRVDIRRNLGWMRNYFRRVNARFDGAEGYNSVSGGAAHRLIRARNDNRPRKRWPVRANGNNIVRGAFLDARTFWFHDGVDFPVDDTNPERGAPSWASHRVYAVESGVVHFQRRTDTRPSHICTQNRTAVGRFIYSHVVPTVSPGTHVRAGQMVGWTCRGRWHIHLSEKVNHRHINPLRPSGVLDYRNPLAPDIHEIAVFTPCDGRYRPVNTRVSIPRCGRKLDPRRISGTVDVRFHADAPQPKIGVFKDQPWLYSPNNPYSADLRVTRIVNGRARGSMSRNIWTADWFHTQKPVTVHWAPGFGRWLPYVNCALTKDYDTCKGQHWYRAFAQNHGGGNYTRYWNTRRVPNGEYRILISVTNHSGRTTRRAIRVRVAN